MTIKKKGVVGKLTYQQLNNWKTSIYEMHEAKYLAQVAELEFRLMRKDLEISDLRSNLFVKNKLDAANDRVESAKVEYERIKCELEKELGYSLNEKVIDEFSLEIKDLNDLK